MYATNILVFDQENKQEDYKYMARNIKTKELEIGYIVVEKSWYLSEDEWKYQWRYWLIKNDYSSTEFNNKGYDLGFKKVEVDKDTIEIYTQIANIKWNQEHNMITKIVKKFYATKENDKDDNIVVVINTKENIPFQLWL